MQRTCCRGDANTPKMHSTHTHSILSLRQTGPLRQTWRGRQSQGENIKFTCAERVGCDDADDVGAGEVCHRDVLEAVSCAPRAGHECVQGVPQPVVATEISGKERCGGVVCKMYLCDITEGEHTIAIVCPRLIVMRSQTESCRVLRVWKDAWVHQVISHIYN